MKNTIITTSLRQIDKAESYAKNIALELDIPYLARRKKSLSKIMDKENLEYIFVVDYQNNLSLIKKGQEAIKFHPGLSLIRIKRIIENDLQADSFSKILELGSNTTLLDCTLGQASDAIFAQFVARDGQVTGLEKDKYLAYLTKHSLSSYRFIREASDKIDKELDRELLSKIEKAMKKIKVINSDYKDFLLQAPDKSFDYVYFDPMFRSTIDKSISMQDFSPYAIDESLNLKAVEEAKRVAKKMVILKERTYSPEFERLGFNVITRANSSTSYGIIKIN